MASPDLVAFADLPYHQSIAGCLQTAIGRHGLDAQIMTSLLAALQPACAGLRQQHADRSLALLRIAEDTADIEAAEAALTKLSRGAHTIVFFGTGGSGLGGQTLAQFGGWNIPGMADSGQMRRPRTRFYDNLDAGTLEAALAHLDLAGTRFVVTSKSGGTVETLVQAIAALSAVKAAGMSAQIPDLFLGLTEPEMPGRSNGLRKLFSELGIPMLEHHTGIGGRFSVLTNVGLLPALARGIDVRAIRAGAKAVVDQLLAAKDAADIPAAVGAATAVGLLREHGIKTHVMMPYADQLGRFSHWFVQLWAESLGKNGQGTSPIACLGPLDQHSQLQLFQDGPRDHLITILRTPTAGRGPAVDAAMAATAGIPFMAGRHIGDLVAAQTEAVPGALRKAERPVRIIDIPKLDAYALGALLMHFMLETILVAALFDIDPYDQPAVELAKTLAREHLAGQI
jgi:glucose-6-phosphate isomerase